MRHTHTTEGQRGSARLLAWGLRQGGVGILVGLLLLPVGVMAQEAGDLDPSFGVDGKVTTDFVGEATASAVALQPDGKIVVAGRTSPGTGPTDFALARYHSNGALDTTFGGDGRVTTDFVSLSLANAIAVQPNGKIVAAGQAFDPFDPPAGLRHGFALARYHPNGRLDTTFGDDGLVITDAKSAVGVNAVALQRDGKIVVAGQAGNDFALARYHRNGTLDTTFGDDGLVVTDFGGHNDFATAVALQPDGKIVVAGQGSSDPIGGTGFALARYHPNGTLDTTFGDNGLVITDFGGLAGGRDFATAVALQPDGKIVAAGQASPGTGPTHFALARYHPNGTLDTTFGGDGRVITDFIVNGFASATAVALQQDGRIVAAGHASSDISRGDRNFALARYHPNGTLDTVFGGDGLVVTDFGAITSLSRSPSSLSPTTDAWWWPVFKEIPMAPPTLPWRVMSPGSYL